ncbi:DUF3011 domain-containing protein [Lysobacter sp. TAF61]|uniref:DUF3011 domain-containing protein n=1 Tax=Lysobacter sp. TAF61 TaxID=3233072 RepID=UPI003F94C06E
MATVPKQAVWLLSLTLLATPILSPARGAGGAFVAPMMASSSSGQMQVGLTLLAPDSTTTQPPDPASLDFPASPNAVLCHSPNRGYRECRTPFRGPVRLSREITGTRCVEDRNWGWRDGAIWVDQGCGAVFMRIGV